MPVPLQSSQRICFRSFELDLTSGELRRDGRKLALPPKAFAVLKALVERPGEVVTREELRTKLWPADTFVEFDDSLNHAVKKLRQVLGDSAEDPQFIETLPRYGYRFIGTEVEGRVETGSACEIAVQPPATTSFTLRPGHAQYHRVWIVAVCAGVILLVLSTSVLVHKEPVQALTEKDIVVMADFVNKTTDPVFTDTLRQGLLIEMGQSPFFNFLPASKVSETLELTGHNAHDPLNDDLARQVCQRNQAKAFIGGSIASLGAQYIINLKAVNCSTGDVLAQQQTQVANKEDVIRALSSQASLLRGKLGESLASIQKFDVPLEQATTGSLAALQAYTIGRRKLDGMDMQSAIAPFQRAIELDPDFAMAYMHLAAVYGNMEQTNLMEENDRKAYALRSRTSEAEKLRIEAAYNYSAKGDRYKGLEVFRLIKDLYPSAAYPYNGTGGIYRDIGEYRRALLEDQEYDRRRPSVMSIANIVDDLLLLGRLDDAQKVLAEGEARHLKHELLLREYYTLAFFQHDSDQMEKAAAATSGYPEMERVMLALQADTEAYYGRLRRSRRLRQQAVEACLQHGLHETAAANYAAVALQESDVGNYEEARQLAAKSLELARTRTVLAVTGITYAQSGDTKQAQAIADELGRSYPYHTLANLTWGPSIRASIDNEQGDAAGGIEELQRAVSIELGNSDVTMNTGLTLRPVHVRGLSYLRLHRGAEAAAEFRKITDHPGYIGPNTVTALAHLGLAHAHALQGDATKARAEYEYFLNLWKDADPDIPIYQQAKAEYAKLH